MNKIILYGTIVTSLLASIFFYEKFARQDSRSPNVNIEPKAPVAQQPAYVSTSSTAQSTVSEKPVGDVIENDLDMETQELNDKELFERTMKAKKELGYIQKSEYNSYNAYDDTSLLALIEQGDKLAALQYVDNGDFLEDSCSRAEVAIRTGITGSPIDLLYMCARNAAREAGPPGSEARHQATLNKFAILEYAALRGDFRAMRTGEDYSEVEFTQADLEKINTLALNLLKHINKYRTQYGLSALRPVAPEDSPMREIRLLSQSKSEKYSIWERRLLGIAN